MTGDKQMKSILLSGAIKEEKTVEETNIPINRFSVCDGPFIGLYRNQPADYV
jgi:hypothetical protein